MANQIYKENGLSLDVYLKCDDMFEDAYASMQNGEYEKALMGFQAVVAINSKNPQSYGNMGICYAQLGKKAEAFAAFDKALELDPMLTAVKACATNSSTCGFTGMAKDLVVNGFVLACRS
jgi:tetratricopeptide (TPR) repeat protein